MDSSEHNTIPDKMESFFANYRLRKYEKGQILILNGDETDYVYHLVSGKVKVYDVTYRGEEIVLNIFKPLSFFPMSLAINKTPNPYIYEAETDIEVHQVPADDALQYLKSNPDVVLDLLSRVYKGVDGLLGRMAALMSGTAKNRLVYELVLEARRFGTTHKDGSCSLSINEKDIGARAGLSRETVSREIRKLKAEKIVSISPHGIVIDDLRLLEAKLDQEV